MTLSILVQGLIRVLLQHSVLWDVLIENEILVTVATAKWQ